MLVRTANGGKGITAATPAQSLTLSPAPGRRQDYWRYRHSSHRSVHLTGSSSNSREPSVSTRRAGLAIPLHFQRCVSYGTVQPLRTRQLSARSRHGAQFPVALHGVCSSRYPGLSGITSPTTLGSQLPALPLATRASAMSPQTPSPPARPLSSLLALVSESPFSHSSLMRLLAHPGSLFCVTTLSPVASFARPSLAEYDSLDTLASLLIYSSFFADLSVSSEFP